MTKRKQQLPQWLALILLIVLALLLVVAIVQFPDEGDQAASGSKVHIVEPLPRIDYPEVTAEVDVPEEPEVTPLPTISRLESGLALVIDDVGYDLPALRRLLALQVPVAIAVIPDAPYAKEAAELAHAAGQMVMLHLPMEPASEKYRNRMTPYFLHAGMDRNTLRATFLKGLAKVPYVEGVNNHMGSFLTEKSDAMRWVMQVCREQGLFFIDSKTSYRSVAADMAKLMDVAWASRQVFLDHDLDREVMQGAWDKAVRCAEKGHRCILIGHPHEESVAFLEQQLGTIDLAGLVPVRQLLRGGDATAAVESEVTQ